ncbi:helix-turn-helix transcriptional regulator [Saccharococcus sp. Marseille-Q5394]|uniref:helix-turn-helix transcriptional regulator n=1 Tax=Saccharococcus sp. Marseille-Q5394 TaxID=2972778 RepID=UPI0021CA4EAB|nr:WYL domain-containing protein [Saccharococcus sp. Marseille-Q5394]
MTKNPITARERLLEVIRILEAHSDEDDMLSIHDIHSRFPEDFQVGIGAVREDVAALEESIVFPVSAMQKKPGMPKHYYYDGRPFEIHELRLLMDAISAAKFISRNETERMLMKIRKLTSRRLAKQLTNVLHVAEPSAQDATDIVATVQLLHEAIHDKRIVAFQYGRYGTDLHFHLSNEGQDYLVHPLGLVWNNDRYYLVAYFTEADEVRQYRLDRMRNVRVQDKQFVPDPYFDLQEYTKKMFHMFGGELISLEARFADKLINVVIDRFGLDANIKDNEDGTFLLKAQVAMSEGLVRWLFRWGGDVKVIHPKELVGRMKMEAEKIYNQYE